MIGVIVATHGDYAKTAMELVGMLYGDQENVTTIGFYPGESLEVLVQRFQQALEGFGSGSEVVVLCDIKGGSPGNVAALMQNTKPGVAVLYGFNITMLVQVFEDRNAGEAMSTIVLNGEQAGKEAVCALPLIDRAL